MSVLLSITKDAYLRLDDAERILFLRWIREIDRWKLEYAQMPESAGRFYRADLKRK